MKPLFILNGTPSGSECSQHGIRPASSLAKIQGYEVKRRLARGFGPSLAWLATPRIGGTPPGKTAGAAYGPTNGSRHQTHAITGSPCNAYVRRKPNELAAIRASRAIIFVFTSGNLNADETGRIYTGRVREHIWDTPP